MPAVVAGQAVAGRRAGQTSDASEAPAEIAEPCRLQQGFGDRRATEISEAKRISTSYVSRILRLALLAPDLVEAILGGWADQRMMLERLERPLPLEWEKQSIDLLYR